MKLLTVILHYGDPAMTQELCRVLREANPERHDHVRVLDNAAPLPVKNAWRRETENRFWAGALELSLALAGQEGFSHLWFLNNDIRFLRAPRLDGIEARLQRIERTLETPVGLWSPSVTANPYHPQMCPLKGANGLDALAVRRVRLVDCVAPLLCLDAVEAVGGLDAADNPKGYGVDLWLSLRLAQKGFAVLVDQELAVRHKAHGTAKKIPDFMRQAALEEAQFCATRLGSCWQERLEAMKLEDADPSHLIRL